MMNDTETPFVPRWDLSPVYASFDAPEYVRGKELLREKAAEFLNLLKKPLAGNNDEAAEGLLNLIKAYESTGDLAENLESYAHAVYTANTTDSRALNEINALEGLILPLGKGTVLLRSLLAQSSGLVRDLASANAAVRPYAFFIEEGIARASHQMDSELEDLSNDLGRSGGEAWGRLQDAISSSLVAELETSPDASPGASPDASPDATAGATRLNTGKVKRKTVTALRDMAHHGDRQIREKAYYAELGAWKTMEVPLAAALNGVKGSAITADKRRGWKSPLEKSLFQSRISMPAFDALLGAMETSLPVFQRYLKTKASALGLKSCAFYDLFAPLCLEPSASHGWTWKETEDFILRHFNSFDEEMGEFANHAFRSLWIDAEGRESKVGGAYCTSFPVSGVSRILCNFAGNFDSVTTVAHELGHAWHHELVKNMSRAQRLYPMTLAETASIFSETIIFEAALSETPPPLRIVLLEKSLQDSCQVIVDILSRFYFEMELFERREEGELSAQELCDIMTKAQLAAYGDGLDKTLLHPYMWAVKSHYYNPGLGFYNYPYAFGQLFALGLYSRYKTAGRDFAQAYRELLRLSGMVNAEDAAGTAGFDISGPAFWRSGIALIEERVREFEALTKESTAAP